MTADASPTARALIALEAIQNSPGITAARLAERLGVTERAARRYVAILREAGIAVDAVRGRHGGYRLRRGTRLPPVSFTQDEALGLVMAVLDGRPAATDSGDLVGSALGKVIQALPEGIGRQAAALREHAAAAPEPGPARHPDPAVTSVLVDAIAARREVRIEYRSEAGNEWEADVDPWAVVVRHARWYLLCRSHRAQAVRTYRIDRVLAARGLDSESRRPENLDAVAVLEENLGTGWTYPTRVVFDAPAEQVARWITPPMGRLRPAPDAPEDRCVLVGSTRNPAMYVQEWLAGIPFPFHVEAGVELCDALAALVARLSAALHGAGEASHGQPHEDAGRQPIS